MARSTSTNLTVPGASMSQIEASDRRSCAQPVHLAPAGPVDQEPAGLRRAGVRREAVRPDGGLSLSVAALRRSSARCRASSTSSTMSPIATPTGSIRSSDADRSPRERCRCRWLPPRLRSSAPPRSPRRSRSAGSFGLVAAAYVALQALYSGPLKHIVIIDVLTSRIGFVLRAAPARLRSTCASATGCSSARSCWRCSSRWRSGATSWCCWPTARRATGRSSASTVPICSIR